MRGRVTPNLSPGCQAVRCCQVICQAVRHCQALSGASVRPAVRCCQCCRVLSGAYLTSEGLRSCRVLSELSELSGCCCCQRRRCCQVPSVGAVGVLSGPDTLSTLMTLSRGDQQDSTTHTLVSTLPRRGPPGERRWRRRRRRRRRRQRGTDGGGHPHPDAVGI